MEERSVDEVIQDIAFTLCSADGEFIEEIANRVLTRKVKYKQDGWFLQEQEK